MRHAKMGTSRPRGGSQFGVSGARLDSGQGPRGGCQSTSAPQSLGQSGCDRGELVRFVANPALLPIWGVERGGQQGDEHSPACPKHPAGCRPATSATQDKASDHGQRECERDGNHQEEERVTKKRRRHTMQPPRGCGCSSDPKGVAPQHAHTHRARKRTLPSYSAVLPRARLLRQNETRRRTGYIVGRRGPQSGQKKATRKAQAQSLLSACNGP